MARPDTDAQAALAQDILRPVYVAWLDILNDPVRVTTAPYDLTFNGTGDTDLDGQTFSAVDGTLINISQIVHKEGGGDTVTATLSGLIGVDSDLLNQIGDRSHWVGRNARLWRLMLNPDLTKAGKVWNFYTGYMTVPKLVGDSNGQTIALTIENYLNYMSAASNRSYLNQSAYDPGDKSAEAAIAVANGTSGVGLSDTGARTMPTRFDFLSRF